MFAIFIFLLIFIVLAVASIFLEKLRFALLGAGLCMLVTVTLFVALAPREPKYVEDQVVTEGEDYNVLGASSPVDKRTHAHTVTHTTHRCNTHIRYVIHQSRRNDGVVVVFFLPFGCLLVVMVGGGSHHNLCLVASFDVTCSVVVAADCSQAVCNHSCSSSSSWVSARECLACSSSS